MYCNTAISFEPTIAMISAAPEVSPLAAAKSRCNLAVAKAMGSDEPDVISERNTACESYEKLK